MRTDGVDIEVTQDTGAGYDVGWVTPGEWLQYSMNVATAGTYTLEVRYATQGFGGNMHIEFDGQNKTGSIALPDIGDWQAWGTVSVPVTLNAGAQLMRLAFDTGNNGWLANINYVRITAGTAATDAIRIAGHTTRGRQPHHRWPARLGPLGTDRRNERQP